MLENHIKKLLSYNTELI